MPQSTLLIPDISGFTKFVKTTELEHSKHIIEELINLIVKNGSEVFELVEIEGDAVFFYKQESFDAGVIEKVTKQVFRAFHRHLSQYEHGRICQCGACLQAVDLKLKFVVHSGETTLANFDNQQAKPYGDPVIAVHRLLKNDISLDEYVLFSKDFLNGSKLEMTGNGVKKDDELGTIPFEYLGIEEWKSDLSVLESEDHLVDFEIETTADFHLSQELLFNYISDFRYRSIWNKEAEEINFDDQGINQIGTEHICVIDGKRLNFETSKPDTDAEVLTYGEILKNPAPLKYLESNFFISKSGDKLAKLQIVFRGSVKWKIQLLLLPIMKKKMKQQAQKAIDGLQNGIKEYQEMVETEVVPSEASE